MIDEIQHVKELFAEIVSIVNQVKAEKGAKAALGMYILTGSQKFQLMQHVSESMAGRVGIIERPTLSQVEIRGWDSSVTTVNNDYLIRRSLDREITNDEIYKSIIRGFYPGRWEFPDDEIKKFFDSYIKTYLEQDVRDIKNVQDLGKFKDLIYKLAYSTGRDFIPEDIANEIGIKSDTVRSWVNVLVTSDIVTLVQPYYESSVKKRLVKGKKIYFNDTGLVCHIMGIKKIETLLNSPFKGSIIETYIFNEIKKSYINNGIEPRFFYYRDSNQNEIDLLFFNEDGKWDLIECKSGSNYGINHIKEFKQMESSAYGINGGCIICFCKEPKKINANTFEFPIRCI